MFKQIVLIALLLLSVAIQAQDFKFGKISKQELEEKVYAKDSSAAAAVLYRKLSVSYNYVKSSGFQVVTNIHERIKIYNKEGFDYATVSERLYTNNSDRESLLGLKAYTYNIENEKIIKSKLKSSETFSKELSKYYKEEKFTMPNLKEGSVIEYQYKVTSPFAYSIDEIVLQYDIPIKKQLIKIAIPEYYNFKTSMKGYLTVMPKNEKESRKINFASGLQYGSNLVDYFNNATSYKMTDVPALKEEPYVNNINNYRSSIDYEIQYVKFPNSAPKHYASSWEDVVKTIYKSDNFGKQLNSTKYYKDDIANLLTNSTSEIQKAGAIFSYVQQHMNWNDYIGKYTEEGVKNAYEKKSGSVADINLMLVSMLKNAGLKANPVLISTRDNGVPLFPTREGFNYVVASLELEGQNILLDACNKYTEPNLLPVKALNWMGRVIEEDGSSSVIAVTPKKLSKKLVNITVNLKENGDIEGKERETRTFYNAYLFRNRYNSVNEEDYLDKKENNNDGVEISNYKIKNKNVLGKPIVEDYEFFMENQSDVIGDKIYFSPLFYNTEKENPFKLEERNYPIDFVFPWQEKYMTSITIPDGYEITSMPENMKLSLPNNMGSFTYKIGGKGKVIQLIVDVRINQAIIPVGDYTGIKELYKNIVEKETEKVVLSKI